MKTLLRAPTDGNTPDGAGQGDTGMTAAMDSWGSGDNPIAPQQDGGQTPAQTSDAGQQQQQQAPAQQQTPTQTQQPAQQQGQTPAATTPPVDSAALIRAAVDATAKALAPQRQVQQQVPATPMSNEEFNKHYGIIQIDEKALERLFDKDPKAAATWLNQVLENNRAASLRMAQDLFQAQMSQQLSAFQPKLSAMEKFMAEQHEAKATDRFYTTYPDLRAEQDLVKEILDATHTKIARGELKFTDEKQAFQFIADAAKKLVSRMQPAQNGTGAPARGQQSSTQSHGRQMAAATSSAPPGRGQAGKPADELSSMMASWDQRPD